MANEIVGRTNYCGLRHRTVEESKTAQFKELVMKTYFITGS